MPYGDSFVAACRTAILACSLYAEWIAARVVDGDTSNGLRARWGRLFEKGPTGSSLAGRFRKEINNIVRAEGDKAGAAGSGVVTPLECQAVATLLIAEFAPSEPRPSTQAQAAAELNAALDGAI